MYMYVLCVTGSVAWFWGDVCAPQVCLEGNCFTVCGDLHAILCAVKRQVFVVHRPFYILSLEGSTALEDGTPAGSLEGRPSWKTGQDFVGGHGLWVKELCWSMQRDTHLLICVRVMDMYVYMLCVTGRVD